MTPKSFRVLQKIFSPENEQLNSFLHIESCRLDLIPCSASCMVCVFTLKGGPWRQEKHHIPVKIWSVFPLDSWENSEMPCPVCPFFFFLTKQSVSPHTTRKYFNHQAKVCSGQSAPWFFHTQMYMDSAGKWPPHCTWWCALTLMSVLTVNVTWESVAVLF